MSTDDATSTVDPSLRQRKPNTEQQDENKPNVAHLNQGAGRSTAHICSNTESCPTIALFEATPVDERDSIPLSENLYACSACRSVMYCSTDCQTKHWMSGHKTQCPAMAAAYRAKHPEQFPAAKPATASAASTAAASSPRAKPKRNINVNIHISASGAVVVLLALLVILYFRYRAPTSLQDGSNS